MGFGLGIIPKYFGCECMVTTKINTFFWDQLDLLRLFFNFFLISENCSEVFISSHKYIYIYIERERKRDKTRDDNNLIS